MQYDSPRFCSRSVVSGLLFCSSRKDQNRHPKRSLVLRLLSALSFVLLIATPVLAFKTKAIEQPYSAAAIVLQPVSAHLRLNNLPAFWEKYHWYLLALIGVMAAEALLIVFLLSSRSQRRKAETERARLTQMVGAEHRRLEEVVANIPGIVWESRLDSDGATRSEHFVSRYVEKLLGYTVDEWMSEPRFWLSIIPEEEREEVLRQNDEIFKSGKGGIVQMRWRAKDGRILWVEGHQSIIFDDDKKPIGLRGVTFDITDRKLAESSLRDSEERNRAILRAMPDLMFLQDRDGTYLDFYASDSNDLLVPPDQFLGKKMEEILPPSLTAGLEKCFRQAEETQEPQTYEYSLPTTNGSDWFEARIVATEGNKILSVVRDVSERRQAEQALRESEARFRMMANTAPMMVWMSNTEQLCTFVNRSWLEFTGRPIELELGTGWMESLHPDDNEILQPYWAAVDQRQSFQTEFRLKRYDGEYRWLFGEAVPRYTPEGDFAGYVGSCLDVTERRDAEAALRVALAEVHDLKDQLEQENIYLRDEIRLEYEFEEIVGNSDEIKYVLFKVQQVAPTDATVLILGETGTGKELVARAIHNASNRKDRPLVKINCATLPASLIESELFGHEKGAFTGAQGRKIGRFEVADGATLFLDEIGELPLELQSKLLRVLQEGEFERLGSSQTRKVDVRIIAATNRNLKVEVQNGLFREDLWYRLNVFPITVPPLRHRKRDIPALVSFFVNRFNRKLGRVVKTIPPRTLQALEHYYWPGNIRELANVVERAIINSDSTVLKLADKLEGHEEVSTDIVQSRTIASLEEVERQHILNMLELCDWRIEGANGAAEILGINASTLRSRMSKLGIKRPGRTVSAGATS
jgi:PAS domain S-box-containing protein